MTKLIAIAALVLAFGMSTAKAQTVISQGPAGKTSSSGMIAAEKGPERYGGHHVNNTYSHSYSYSIQTYGDECAGLGRLECGLARQGRRISGF